nr:hypothetical protein [Tanacetum cinerariifolium]
MTSFGYRLNPRYAIKECSSCGTLYTRDCSCSKGTVEDKILVPKPPKNYARCGHPVNGPYCQGCTLLREKLKEDLVTYFQNFQNISESSDDSTNVVNAPREPVVVKQDHGVNPSHIDECCCECGNALDGIFCQQCTCKSCGKEKKRLKEEQAAKARYWKIPACCDDDDDYNYAITPVLSTEEPVDSLSMGDEHLDTIPATKSDKIIKYSVEDLVPIPSESKGLPDTMCDVHLVNNPTPLKAKDHFEIALNSNDDISSSDDDSLYNENIDGSTTTHSDISLSEYDSFIFDLANDQFPPTDMSDLTHEEFADELAYIISLLKYDCFYFRNFPDLGELISILNSRIRENPPSTTRVNLPIKDDHSPLLAYVVWIFLAYLTYLVIPPYLYPFGNEDTIFNLGITINHFYSLNLVYLIGVELSRNSILTVVT